MRRRLGVAALCLGIVGAGAACSADDVDSRTGQLFLDLDNVPQEVSCTELYDDVPVVVGELQCYWLTVPQFHDDPTPSRGYRLAIARHRAATTRPAPSPMIFIPGGPGAGGLRSINDVVGLHPLATVADRDTIFFDPRGTGRSDSPGTIADMCPDWGDLDWSATADPDSLAPAARSAGAECYRTHREAGFDLNSIDSVATAHDIELIRRAFGIDTWTVYGASYGSVVAREVARHNPGTTDAAVLAAAVPVEWPYQQFSESVRLLLDTLTESCLDFNPCESLIPDFRLRFEDLVLRLDAQPTMIEPPADVAGEPPVLIDDDNVMLALWDMVRSNGEAAALPALVAALDTGDASAAYWTVRYYRSDLNEVADGPAVRSTFVPRVVRCRDDAASWNVAATEMMEVKKIDGQGVDPLTDPFAAILDNFEGGGYSMNQCRLLGVEVPEQDRRTRVGTDVPVLIYNDSLDWGTDVAAAEQNAVDFDDAHVIMTTGRGHAALDDPCIDSQVAAFVDDPNGFEVDEHRSCHDGFFWQYEDPQSALEWVEGNHRWLITGE